MFDINYEVFGLIDDVISWVVFNNMKLIIDMYYGINMFIDVNYFLELFCFEVIWV